MLRSLLKKNIENIRFFKTKGFWAGSVMTDNVSKAEQTVVFAYAFSDILKKFMPTVIICDTEGQETKLFHQNVPSCVHLIIMELHPNLYGQDMIKTLFDRLSDMQFSYIPYGSRGPVVCFGRKNARRKLRAFKILAIKKSLFFCCWFFAFSWCFFCTFFCVIAIVF